MIPIMRLLHYRRQTKFAKLMFLHLSVSHSVHRGVFASVHAGIQPQADPSSQADTPHRADPLGSRHPAGAETPPGQTPPWNRQPPVQCMLEDMANKRSVRNLPECILVSN